MTGTKHDRPHTQHFPSFQPDTLSSRLLSPRGMVTKDRNKLVDLLLLPLQDALGDPDKVSDFLLLQLDVGIKDGKVHLVLKRQLEDLHIALIKGIVDALLAGAGYVDVPDGGVLGEQFKHTAELLLIRHVGEHGGTGGVQVSDGGVQTLAIREAHGGLVEWSTEGVESDVDGVGVGPDFDNVSHDLSSVATELLHELVKVLQPVLDEGRLDDFNLDLLEDVADLSAHVLVALLEELSKVRADGSVDQHGLVEILVSAGGVVECGDTPHGTLLEHSEGVALRNQLVDITATEGSLEQQHDVLNHVLVRDKVNERRKRLHGLCPQVLEFRHDLRVYGCVCVCV